MKYFYDYKRTDVELEPYMEVAVYDTLGEKQLMKLTIPKDAIPNITADFIQHSIKEFDVYHVTLTGTRSKELILAIHVTYANQSVRKNSAESIKEMFDRTLKFIKGGLI